MNPTISNVGRPLLFKSQGEISKMRKEQEEKEAAEEAKAMKQEGYVHLENGSDFVKFIDSIYQSEEKPLKKINTLVPSSVQMRLLFNDDSFFLTAAKKLSFNSLAYLRNKGIFDLFGNRFKLEGKILPAFFASLEDPKLGSDEKKRRLDILMFMNFQETKKAVVNSRNMELFDLYYELRRERGNSPF